jgi:hypothetical protein
MPKMKPRWRDGSDDPNFYRDPAPQPRPRKRKPLMAPPVWHRVNSEDQPRRSVREVIAEIMRADPDISLKRIMIELEARGIELSATSAGEIKWSIARGK